MSEDFRSEVDLDSSIQSQQRKKKKIQQLVQVYETVNDDEFNFSDDNPLDFLKLMSQRKKEEKKKVLSANKVN